MKVFLDEFFFFAIWMKVYLTEGGGVSREGGLKPFLFNICCSRAAQVWFFLFVVLGLSCARHQPFNHEIEWSGEADSPWPSSPRGEVASGTRERSETPSAGGGRWVATVDPTTVVDAFCSGQFCGVMRQHVRRSCRTTFRFSV